MITIKQAKKIVKKFEGKRILVVGDLMLDRYVVGNVSRISPEAPVPVVHVTGKHSLPGGASNVALNIQTLGGQAIVAGVVGTDQASRELCSILSGKNISMEGMIKVDDFRTTVKTRILAERQQVCRVDSEDTHENTSRHAPALIDRLKEIINKSIDGIIIEDYGKGVISQKMVNVILAEALRKKIPVGFDPKFNLSLKLSRLALATPNLKEAYYNAGITEKQLSEPVEADKNLMKLAAILKKKWGTELLLITLGAHGMYLAPKKGRAVLIPVRAREVFDVSGAGDTVIATTMLGIASGASHAAAAAIANYAAGVVVGKVGTATCTPRELIESIN